MLLLGVARFGLAYRQGLGGGLAAHHRVGGLGFDGLQGLAKAAQGGGIHRGGGPAQGGELLITLHHRPAQGIVELDELAPPAAQVLECGPGIPKMSRDSVGFG